MATLKYKTFQGVRWNFQTQIISQIINFIVGIFLMRLLVPEDFGKFTMLLVVFSFLQIVRDGGLTQAIIQNKNLSKDHSSSAFWFQISFAALLGFLLLNTSTIFNYLYDTSHLEQIVFWFVIDFFIGSIGLVPIALLKKELQFKILFNIQITSIIVSSLLAIYMALTGWGYYSLIAKLLLWTTINSIGALWLVSWKPKFRLSQKAFKELINFGIPVTGNHLLSFLVRNTDDFFIGKVMGASALGLYNRAYALMLLPMGNLTSVLQNVLLPSWSKMQEDRVKIKNTYLKVTGIIAFIAFPVMTLLSIFAIPVIEVIFGTQWLAMANTLSMLCLIGMIQSVGAMTGTIFMVFNQNKLQLKINIFSSIFTIAIVVWSIYQFQSIEITAMLYGMTSLLLIYPSFYYTGKIMGASIGTMIKPLLIPLLFSVLIGIIAWLLFSYLPLEGRALKLILAVLIAAISYLGIHLLFKTKVMEDMRQVYSDYKKMAND